MEADKLLREMDAKIAEIDVDNVRLHEKQVDELRLIAEELRKSSDEDVRLIGVKALQLSRHMAELGAIVYEHSRDARRKRAKIGQVCETLYAAFLRYMKGREVDGV